MSFSKLPVSYCTNVHAGRTLAEVESGLDEYTTAVRKRAGKPLAAGLWLARSVASELIASESALSGFRDRMLQREMVCYTLNAFPFGDFHGDRVKEKVYLPDWSTDQRRQYTLDCAKILGALLPDGVEGSMSTMPLGGRMNIPADGPGFLPACYRQLTETAVALQQIHEQTGRMIRLAIEPEPFCELGSIPMSVIPFFNNLRKFATGNGTTGPVQQHIGLCFDVCHQSVEFEDVSASIDLLESNDIRIHKVHISNAIELPDPGNNPEGRKALNRFVEPRYLHQTFAKSSSGLILLREDLDTRDVMRDPDSYSKFDTAESWRIHFHVPVDANEIGPLKTTRPDLIKALQRVYRLPYQPHLEIETYTWDVLPDGKQVDLVEGLTREVEATYRMLESIERDDTIEYSVV